MTDIYFADMDHPNGFMAFCDQSGEYCLDVSVRYRNGVDGGELLDSLFRAYEMVIEELKKRLGNEIPGARTDGK